MAFDIGAGLGAMAPFLGAQALEAQKADQQEKMVKLADQLAGARDIQHQQFQTSEREATQTFTGSENEKQRANGIAIANIGLQGHMASAGATIAAARMQVDALAPLRAAQVEQTKADTAKSQQAIELGKPEIEAKKMVLDAIKSGDQTAINKATGDLGKIDPVFGLRDAQTREAAQNEIQLRLKNSAMTELQDAKDAVLKAQKANDQPALQDAQRRLDMATYNSTERVQSYTSAVTMAKLAQDNLLRVESLLKDASKIENTSTTEGKQYRQIMETEYNAAKQRRDDAMRLAEQLQAGMRQSVGTGGPAAGTNPPPLSSVIKPIKPPSVTGVPAPVMPRTSVINGGSMGLE